MRRMKRGRRKGSQGKPHGAGGPRTDWGEVAGWYDQFVGKTGSEYHREVVIPGALRLLAMAPEESAIDIACGQGVLCRALAERGVAVTGVDAAPELIRAARERGPGQIRYEVGDARELGFLPAHRFDAAACVLAIQNIHPIQPVFAGVSRLLMADGRLVIVMMHPHFRGPKETSWGWDEQRKVQYRRVDRYLLPRKTPIVTHPFDRLRTAPSDKRMAAPLGKLRTAASNTTDLDASSGKDAGEYTWTFHKPLEAYVKALRGAGLLIDAIEEWPSHKTSTSGPRAAAENVARSEIPLFMAIRALKKVPGIRPPD